ncbi:MAG: hypothetical protein V4673_14660 [Pseudomonadota bacterium]
MISAFMLTSGWLFWIFVTAVIVAEISATEADNPFMATVLMAVSIAVIALFSDADLFAVLRLHPIWALSLVPLYFAVGAAWALWKWRCLVVASVAEFEVNKADLISEHQRSEAWKSSPFEDFIRRFKDYPPSAATYENKKRITTWIGFWPFSVLWALLTWPRRLAAQIYKWMVTLFQRMSDAAFVGKFTG